MQDDSDPEEDVNEGVGRFNREMKEADEAFQEAEHGSIDSILQRIGFGKHHLLLYFLLGMFWLADGAEVLVVSIVSTVLQKAWGIADWQVSFLGGIIYLGMIIGTMISGWTGDAYGRRPTLLYGAICLFTTGICSSFMPEYWSFTFTRCLTGVGIGAVIPAASSYAIEVITPKYRGAFQIFLFLLFVSGNFLIVILGFWLIPDMKPDNWRWLLFAAALPTLLSIIGVYFWVEESPRFLAVQGQYSLAVEKLNNIARSGSKLPLNDEEKAIVSAIRVNSDEKWKDQMKELAGPGYRRVTGVMALAWWTLGFSFYGLLFILPRTLSESESDSDVLPDMAISTSVELPSIFLSAVMVEIRFLGRRNSLILCFGLQAITAIVSAPLVSIRSAFVVLTTALNFVINLSLNVVYPYTSELFPTRIRSTSFAVCSAFMRIAGCVAPTILVALDDANIALPYAAIGVMNVLAGAAMFTLKRETLGQSLHETK